MSRKQLLYTFLCFIAVAGGLAALISCDWGRVEETPKHDTAWRIDACARERLYRECLQQTAPSMQNNYTAGSEVIEACASSAERVATLRGYQIKPECRQ